MDNVGDKFFMGGIALVYTFLKEKKVSAAKYETN